MSGALDPSTTRLSKSSARPKARRATVEAVAGAMAMRSTLEARETCPEEPSLQGVKASVCTGAWVIAENVRG
jgi:hypothetical protein